MRKTTHQQTRGDGTKTQGSNSADRQREARRGGTDGRCRKRPRESRRQWVGSEVGEDRGATGWTQ